jgi:hypothetical protein
MASRAGVLASGTGMQATLLSAIDNSKKDTHKPWRVSAPAEGFGFGFGLSSRFLLLSIR